MKITLIFRVTEDVQVVEAKWVAVEAEGVDVEAKRVEVEAKRVEVDGGRPLRWRPRRRRPYCCSEKWRVREENAAATARAYRGTSRRLYKTANR